MHEVSKEFIVKYLISVTNTNKCLHFLKIIGKKKFNTSFFVNNSKICFNSAKKCFELAFDLLILLFL